MPGGVNLAKKYSSKIDERFTRESQAMMATNNDYEFNGVDTVRVFSIPVVPLTDYTRSGLQRYGSPDDLARNVQTMKIKQDKAFTFIIDKGDKIQSMMVSDAGKALSREIDEVIVPFYDSYIFKTLADGAASVGQSVTENLIGIAADATVGAYEALLAGNEALGNANVPDAGRVCFCSYRYANLLKQDSAFMRYGDQSQQMLVLGVIGEVDGVKIVKVPSSRLPVGCDFILAHAVACTAPKQLEDFRIHDDPPGISGWLVEGRFIFDAFILDNKACALYAHFNEVTMRKLNVMTAATDTGKTTIVVPEPLLASGNKRYYATAADIAAFATNNSVSRDTALTSAIGGGYWTEMDDTPYQFEIASPSAGHTVVRVVEVDTSDYPVAVGDAKLYLGLDKFGT